MAEAKVEKAKRCKAIDRGAYGWSLLWEDGAYSYMPNGASARACAAGLDLIAACEDALAELKSWEGHDSIDAPERGVIDALEAALAKAVRP